MSITAKFVKADPLQSGEITYTLKGPKTKEALHAAADLMDMDVVITTPQLDIQDGRDEMIRTIKDYCWRILNFIDSEAVKGAKNEGE